MMRDSKLSRRNSGKNLNFEETENVPVNVNIRESSIRRMSIDSCSRPPLNSIQEPLQNPSKPAQEPGFRSSKTHRTPTKAKSRHQESAMTMRTPEKQGVVARDRFGWGNDSTVNTPRSCRTLGRASLGFPELNSAHSTPTKTVTKPPNPGLIYGGNTRPPVRTGNFAALSKGIPVTSNTCTTVNTIEVPHFDLREDPSFWMDHNVQVLIRIRPLNGMEITSQGYNRCLKQESAQCLTWVGNPETRFTFDHVACETIDQETLFKMVGEPMVENCLSGYNSCMFAYGQTGSGKTHTMLGEINNLEVKPSQYRGMTPRIFEFLFSRIIAEEGSRKNERLTYNCKCSFLEIYNEQITDLLDPSSTNLQLREDVKKGVYVENLTELEVHTVGDILRLLSQGSANRRVASTNMNRESSRSHSVFTCVIESRWEKDSTSNLRFARLNLVDLAGSERQKSSGAEGERLKEAANINKSLSTLGHVIMVLVDGANARTKHVPYRDSRLTFLLQDSLGGNSKTMIIANVSPSISSATETLNTLKFAQRAKLIQNNAVINEDASGDVEALQHQIRLLKEELVTLKRLNLSRSITNNSKHENCSNESSLDNYEDDDEKILRVSCKQLKSLETSLNGALRREQSTENSIKQLEAEIEQLNSLVHQREEENRCTKMMLKFREDKIQRMECLLSGSLSVDSYLLEENKMVNEEIKILRGKVERNPEVTRFAVENIRLLEQLRRFQDFYEEGEREMLLTEVSELRDQLTLSLDQNLNQSIEKESTQDKKQDDFLQLELENSKKELEKFMEKNAKLCREIADLNDLLEMQKSEVIKDEILANNTNEILDLQLEVEILKIILKEERLIHVETDEKFLLITKQCENLKEELQEAKSIIEALEIQNLVSINELEDLKNINNNQYSEITSLKDKILSQESKEQTSLTKVQDSLEKAKKLNTFYQNDRVFHESNEEQMDEVRKQVEAETSEVIVCLQEELCNIQKKMQENSLKERETQQELIILQEKLDVMSECNRTLREKFEEKDRVLFGLCEEIEEVLSVGDMALDDVLNRFVNGKQDWVSEKLKIIARNVYEKELRIEELNSCLEDAKRKSNEMESMLRSLRGAILVMSEAHQQDCNKKDEEIVEKECEIDKLKESLVEKDFAIEVESCCYFDKFLETDFMIEEMKIEISEMKKKEVFLINERESYSILEEQIEEDTISMKKEVEEIEHMILEIQAKNQDLMSFDFDNIKSCVHEMLTWHEEIWCEIIAKDWVVSVLHVCHMGILMETLSGLNVEKSLLHHGLCESNALVSELKGQNGKSRKELEACSMLRGKLLVDIKNGFDRISRKEEETGNLSIKITNFEKKILDLQVMEEAMLERFNHMGDELFTIMKEIDVIEVIHDEDEEKIVIDSFAKEIELLLKLEKMVSINNDLEKEKFSISMELEKFKEDMIISFVDMKLKDSFDLEMSSCKLQHELEMNVEELRLQKEENKRLSIMLKDQKHEIEEAFEELRLQKEENKRLSIMLKDQKHEIEEAFEELRLQKEENKRLSIMLKDQKHEIEEAFEALQCEVYESVVKSHVLDEKNILIESLKEDVKTISCEKDEKEEELKVYEKSVEELECTVNVLENQIKMVKGDAERQRLQREEAEVELHALKQSNDSVIMQRDLDEKEKELQDLLRRNIILQKEIISKDAEIIELNLQKVQSREYNEKIKAMGETTPDVNNINSPLKRVERSGSRSKGQNGSSPFKSIRLGFVQQVNCEKEKDEELISARIRIQELEALVASWQKENNEGVKQQQLLTMENEMLKNEIDNLKKNVMELEVEGQQNLQQQIDHHAKIKEENNVLKAQNDEISHKLKRAEVIIRRVKEELANLRATSERRPC
ncbi:kinesin-like protein KIN-12D [Lactuca sativa]|uniref:Kinesin motor domain-containing protein n=1 Tax=Lactuca sativa TaxID=4236 RepID=A0A9R1X431_LACSA|nr:kinesin-like protein KIN-12D [Lactuca sativa]KAJ0197164.1 hypothetical protein LSAT_V11C700377050 [Lactuca sativa]